MFFTSKDDVSGVVPGTIYKDKEKFWIYTGTEDV
jgi:hypothetical protein